MKLVFANHSPTNNIYVIRHWSYYIAATIENARATHASFRCGFAFPQVSQTANERRVPALTRYKTVLSAGMLDITNKNCGPWLQQQLKDLVQKYQFDAFYLDMGIE